MKHVIIAGGAGFIGSHLCEYLLHKGDRVICLDNFRTGHPKNVSALTNHPYFKLVEHDITMPYMIKGIDEIYNLACPASPIHYQDSPIETTKTSVIGTLNLLELARENHCRFLQASTSEVYGDPEVHPQPESYWGHVNPNGIRSCYDVGKRCAESLCMDYHRRYGVAVKIIRIFNTYEPRMACDDGRVVSNFILQALHHLRQRHANPEFSIRGRPDSGHGTYNVHPGQLHRTGQSRQSGRTYYPGICRTNS